MRSKVILSALLLACAVITGAAYFHRTYRSYESYKTYVVPPTAPARKLAVTPTAPLEVPERFSGIVRDLSGPDHAIQQAALQSAREMDDRAIIPTLQELADRATDEATSKAILDTIDFLNLPSLTDNLAEAKASRAAAGLPDLPKSPTNRWTGRPFASKQ